MLIFHLADETKVIARPSGTEPKLKIYFQVSEPYDDQAVGRADARLTALEETFVGDLLRRQKNRPTAV